METPLVVSKITPAQAVGSDIQRTCQVLGGQSDPLEVTSKLQSQGFQPKEVQAKEETLLPLAC